MANFIELFDFAYRKRAWKRKSALMETLIGQVFSLNVNPKARSSPIVLFGFTEVL